jgi:hypothetical protein
VLRLTALAVAAWCVAAAGTDVAVAVSAGGPFPRPPGPRDGEVELAWDNGRPGLARYYYTGAGVWYGNDFDVSTLTTYNWISLLRVYSDPHWPNSRWDGFRVALYAFTGGQPGELLRGPEFGIGDSPGRGWCDVAVKWDIPAGVTAFVAAVEQFYNHPNCDPFTFDDNLTFQRHSWLYSQGTWREAPPGGPGYRNFMARVVVADAEPAILPTSLGRVKALYY